MYENFNINDVAEAQRIKSIAELLQLIGKIPELAETIVLFFVRQIFDEYRQYVANGGRDNIAPGLVQRIKVAVLYLNDNDLQYVVSRFLEFPTMENLKNIIHKFDETIAKKQLAEIIKQAM